MPGAATETNSRGPITTETPPQLKGTAEAKKHFPALAALFTLPSISCSLHLLFHLFEKRSTIHKTGSK